MALRAAADQLRVDHSLFVRWQHRDAGIADPLLMMLRGQKKSSHPGLIGHLKPLEDGLLRHFFEQRKQGINVETFDLAVKASMMCPVFNAKTFVAKMSAVRRFMQAS